MKNKYYAIILVLALLIPLAGCGGGVGAPGSSGGGDTGIIIKSVAAVPTNVDVDTAIHLCPGGDPEAGLFREDVTLTVDATKLMPNSVDDPFSASVEECTITYLKGNGNPDAPIIESMTVYPNCVLVDGSNTCTMPLLDVQRKIKWWDDITAGTFAPPNPTQYVATIKCKYVSAFGDAGFFQTEVDIWLADWNVC